ncbi:MAG: DUF4442 domain-containing protein [Deltaproteobacteria bacterium]|nr:DUF4442 domain-containing protein [Deltaproteobacteria bacterium]MBW2254235.1 DUF4442 domain-containing protein [Deltaproteobacteria bacterium]
MSRQELEKTLGRVPFLSTLGVRVEEVKPGAVVLRLPSTQGNRNFDGVIDAAAVFAVGQLAAAVALGTHPNLVDLEALQKGASIKYVGTSKKDITAHAEVTEEMVSAIRSALEGGEKGQVEMPVQVLDGHGDDVAELTALFGFRFKI